VVPHLDVDEVPLAVCFLPDGRDALARELVIGDIAL